MTPLQVALAEGRLTYGAWTRTDADGRRLLCLLAAMSPEAARAQNAAACPSRIAPPWLAHLLPWMDDTPSGAYRPEVWRRVADLQARWSVLWPDGWPADVSRRADMRCRRGAVLEARSHAPAGDPVLLSVNAVIGLLDRAIAGDEPTKEEWSVAQAGEAVRAARAAAQATAQAARAAWVAGETAQATAQAAWVAWVAARTAWVAGETARAAAQATAQAAWVAGETARATAWVAGETARAVGETARATVACDRMIAAMLDVIEAEVVAGEAVDAR